LKFNPKTILLYTAIIYSRVKPDPFPDRVANTSTSVPLSSCLTAKRSAPAPKACNFPGTYFFKSISVSIIATARCKVFLLNNNSEETKLSQSISNTLSL